MSRNTSKPISGSLVDERGPRLRWTIYSIKEFANTFLTAKVATGEQKRRVSFNFQFLLDFQPVQILLPLHHDAVTANLPNKCLLPMNRKTY